MKNAIRTTFYIHALVAIYCLMMGYCDVKDDIAISLIPDTWLLLILVATVVILPVVSLVLCIVSKHTEAVLRIFLGHCAIGFAQVIFGISPLFI